MPSNNVDAGEAFREAFGDSNAACGPSTKADKQDDSEVKSLEPGHEFSEVSPTEVRLIFFSIIVCTCAVVV